MHLLQVRLSWLCVLGGGNITHLITRFLWSWPVWHILVCSILLPYLNSSILLLFAMFFMFILNNSFFTLTYNSLSGSAANTYTLQTVIYDQAPASMFVCTYHHISHYIMKFEYQKILVNMIFRNIKINICGSNVEGHLVKQGQGSPTPTSKYLKARTTSNMQIRVFNSFLNSLSSALTLPTRSPILNISFNYVSRYGFSTSRPG